VSFTYAIATDRGRVRLLIADTSGSAYAFEDDEIDYFLTAEGTVVRAAYLAVRTLLADKARRVKRAEVGGIPYDDTAQIAALQALLASLATTSTADLPTVNTIAPATLPMDLAWTATVQTAG